MEVFVPPFWLMIVEIIIGAVMGKIIARVKQAIVFTAVIGFFITMIFFVNENLEEMQSLGSAYNITKLNEYVTVIVVSGITFVLHLLFFEIGSIPVSAFFSKNDS